MRAANVFYITVLSLAALGSAAQPTGEPVTDKRFVKHILTGDFISEGVAVADINKDGKPDIVAGAWWFEAPSWTRHAIAPAKHYFASYGIQQFVLRFLHGRQPGRLGG